MSHSTAESSAGTWFEYAPSEANARRREILDSAAQDLLRGDVARGFAGLLAALDRERRALSPDAWRAWVHRGCRTHRTLTLLREDPFTRRAAQRPRGYAGDASLIDFIYANGDSDLAATSALGRTLHRHAVDTVPCRAVRARCTAMARAIDSVAERRDGARVLSVAAGHLREAAHSTAVRTGGISEIVALDQDPQSLELVADEHDPRLVRTVPGSVKDLLGRNLDIGTFDLVYSSGLYDYLNDRTAFALTRRLFDRLQPGGELVLANFVPTVPGIGYMEAFMDWFLVYRDGRRMLDLASALAPTRVGAVSLSRDETGGIVFLTVTRS